MYRKGVELLLDAVKEIKVKTAFRVDIFGDGEQRLFLENKVKDLRLEEKVKFYGRLPFDDIQERYKVADIFVLPSLRDATGTAVFEAMANKLPVVALKQNGVKDVVGYDSGELINIYSKSQVVQDMALSLAKLIDNRDLRIMQGESGFKKIKNNHLWSIKVKRMDAVYKNVLDTV